MEETAFWKSAGPMTDLGAHAEWLTSLPTDPAELRGVVSRVLLHPAWVAAYGVSVDARGEAERQLRPVAEILTAVRERSEAPLTEPRLPQDRAVGVCRNFTVLYVALLRACGHAARARCGHAGYFETGKWIDHWIAERWNATESRWVRCDPQLDRLQLDAIEADFDPNDLPPGAFLSGGECWQRVRQARIDPDTCGIDDMWGAWFVRSNVVRDLAALNNVELLPWDGWGITEDWSDLGSAPDNALIDSVAAACIEADATGVRACYQDERFRVPSTITSFLNGGPTAVDLDISR